MGWPPKAASFFGIFGERVLLGEDEGGCRGVCAHMYYLSTRQIRCLEAGRIVTTFTNFGETMDECFDGLHHSVTAGSGV